MADRLSSMQTQAIAFEIRGEDARQRERPIFTPKSLVIGLQIGDISEVAPELNNSYITKIPINTGALNTNRTCDLPLRRPGALSTELPGRGLHFTLICGYG